MCRYPPCSVCPKSLKAFVFHTDCFRLAKGRLSKLSISSIWLLGLSGLYYPRQRCWDFAYLTAHKYPASDLRDIIGWLGKLPNELCEMVRRQCPDSPLWRYCAVNFFSSQCLYQSQPLMNGVVYMDGLVNADSNPTSSNDQLKETQKRTYLTAT